MGIKVNKGVHSVNKSQLTRKQKKSTIRIAHKPEKQERLSIQNFILWQRWKSGGVSVYGLISSLSKTKRPKCIFHTVSVVRCPLWPLLTSNNPSKTNHSYEEAIQLAYGRLAILPSLHMNIAYLLGVFLEINTRIQSYKLFWCCIKIQLSC